MSEFITRSISSKGERHHPDCRKIANYVTLQMPSDKLKNLLNPSGNGELANMVERAQAMGALTESLAAALPDDFAGSLVAANIRDDGELVVIAASPAWASRLRFETEKLIAAANQTDQQVTHCSVRVSHDTQA